MPNTATKISILGALALTCVAGFILGPVDIQQEFKDPSATIQTKSGQDDSVGYISFSVINRWSGVTQAVFFDESFDGTLDRVEAIFKDATTATVFPYEATANAESPATRDLSWKTWNARYLEVRELVANTPAARK